MQSSTLPFSPKCDERLHDCQGGILQGAKTNGKTPYPERPRKVAGPGEPDTPEVARSIAAYALDDGTLSYAFLDCLPAGFREQMRTVCMPSSCPHCASLRAPR